MVNSKTYTNEYQKQNVSGFLKKFPDKKTFQNSLRKFGAFMAGMVMPVIGVIIAWGFFTAIVLGVKSYFIGQLKIEPQDWNAELSKQYLWNMDYIVGFGINSIIPILVGFFGGKQIYKAKGAAIGVIASMGVIGGSYNPLFNETMVAITGDSSLATTAPPVMILGAMIAAPLAALILKHLEKLYIEKIPSGFEMLFNNLSVGLIGLILMFVSFWSLSLLAAVLQAIFFLIIQGLNKYNLLWLMPMFIETEKILFLNNAVNHGILGPLGYQEVAQSGQSALFYLDPNPGTGMGLLLAYFMFGKREDKTQSAAAMPVHFIGGIHEVYYPFVLVKPLNLVWLIFGGTFAAGMYQAFDVGGLFTPSPGSIIMNYVALNPLPMNYAGLSVAIFGSLAITCFFTSLMLIFERIARNDRIYFNPITAILMSKVNRLMNTQLALSINKTKPIESITYETKKTEKNHEWEIISYTDSSYEQFIIPNENKKIVRYWYLNFDKQELKQFKANLKNKTFNDETFTLLDQNNLRKKYFVREFANGKFKTIKVRKTDKIINNVSYEQRNYQEKIRTITFKPYLDKKGKEKTYKPLVSKVWYLNEEETMDDLIVKKNSTSSIDLENKHLDLLKNTNKIIFACEAGMGSSAMGAGIVRKLLKEENIKGINVVNFAIKDLPPNAQVIICQNIFKDLVTSKFPEAYIYTIDQFLKKTEYEALIAKIVELRS